jgi:2',3'-cyclic-nucleotide 2'-phosphodiesterase (5'-nucleotidase family)
VGNVFSYRGSYQKIQADVCLKIMSLMKYNAMNLGKNELDLGMNYLQEQASNITFPFLSTNVTPENTPLFLKKVIIKEVENATVAILGVMPDNDALKSRPDLENKENLRILSPVKAIKERVPDLRKNSDFIILLSQLPQDQLITLINDVNGIDVVISCQYPNKQAPPGQQKTPVVQIKPGGFELGYLKIEKDQKGHMKIIKDEKIILDQSIQRDKKTLEMVNKFYLQKTREEKILSQRQKIHEEVKELLKLTPSEYMEQLQKTDK